MESKGRKKGDSRQQGLEKAYAEVGEEARYRHQLMHNSYYLFTIVLGVFVGTGVDQYYKGNLGAFAIICLLASGVFLFIATIIYVNNRKRTAAWARRLEIECNLVNHDNWRVQRDVIQGRKEHVANKDGKRVFRTKEKNWIDKLQAGKIPHIIAVIAGIWFLIGFVTGLRVLTLI